MRSCNGLSFIGKGMRKGMEGRSTNDGCRPVVGETTLVVVCWSIDGFCILSCFRHSRKHDLRNARQL